VSYSLGTASGRIRIDYDSRGVAQARDDLGRFVASNNKTKESLNDTARAAGITSIAIGVGFAYAAKKAIEFEKQISAIGAVSGATKQDLELLRKKALQLGSDTSFSATEAAMAMEELAKAGIGVSDILNGAADAAVALAAAGGVTLPEAATLAADAMSSFGLRAQDMMKVVDLIAGAANASSIDVSQFGLALKAVGAVAHLAGISFADTATAIALMGKMGIKGSDAGTSLKTMLMNLNPTTSKQITLMRELGIITGDGANKFFDAAGKAKSLADISQILNEALKDQTQQQRLATLEILFGSDAIRAAAILSDQGAAGFNNMANAMGKVSAADVAKTRLDNVSGAIEQFKGSAETLAITLGTMMLPAIKRVTEFLTKLTNWLNNLDPKWQKLIGYGLLAGMVLFALIAVVAAIGAAIIGLGASVVGLKIAAIVTAIVVGLVALGVAFKKAWDSSTAFRSAISSFIDVAKEAATKIGSALRPLFDYVVKELLPALKEAFISAWAKMQPAFEAIASFLETRVRPAFDKLAPAITRIMPVVVTVAKFLGGLLVGAIKLIGAAIGWLVPKWLQFAGPVFSFVVTAIVAIIRTVAWLVDAFRTGFSAVVGFVSSAISTIIAVISFITAPARAVFGLLVTIISTAISIITAVIAIWMAFFKATFSAIWSFIGPPLVATFEFLKSLFSTVFSFLKDLVSNAWSAITGFFSSAGDKVSSIVGSVFGWVVGFVMSSVAKIVAVINGISAIVGMIRSFFNQLRDAASGGVGSLVSFVSGIPGKVLSALGNLGSLLYGAGRDVIQGLINGISNMIGSLMDKARSVANSVKDTIAGALHIGSPSRVMMQIGKWTVQGLALGIEKANGLVRRAASATLSAISNGLGSAPVMYATSGGSSATSNFSNSSGDGRSSRGFGYDGSPPPSSPGIQVNQSFNVPNAMGEADVANYAARRLVSALDGVGVGAGR